jgi:hypothetical protein
MRETFELAAKIATSALEWKEDSPPDKLDVKGSGDITDAVHNGITVWRNKGKEQAVLLTERDAKLLMWKQREGGEEPFSVLSFDPEAILESYPDKIMKTHLLPTHAPPTPVESLRIARERELDRLVALVAASGQWDPCDLADGTRAQLLMQWDTLVITEDDLDNLAEEWDERGKPDSLTEAVAQLMEAAWL